MGGNSGRGKNGLGGGRLHGVQGKDIQTNRNAKSKEGRGAVARPVIQRVFPQSGELAVDPLIADSLLAGPAQERRGKRSGTIQAALRRNVRKKPEITIDLVNIRPERINSRCATNQWVNGKRGGRPGSTMPVDRRRGVWSTTVAEARNKRCA